MCVLCIIAYTRYVVYIFVVNVSCVVVMYVVYFMHFVDCFVLYASVHVCIRMCRYVHLHMYVPGLGYKWIHTHTCTSV